MSASAVLLLGRAPGPASVVWQVRDGLRAAGVRVSVAVLPRGCPDAVDIARSADLCVPKDLPAAVLAELAAAGVHACNAPAAAARAQDKAHVLDVLAAAGVPVPRSVPARTWAGVRDLAGGRPAVVKPRTGSGGGGVLLLDGDVPGQPPGPGPWLVQDRVPGDGEDRKLYVAGSSVTGVRRRWPAPADRSGTPFDPGPGLGHLALAAARALGLEICGVDVVPGPDGPVVVDANGFPGFKGVPGAARHLTHHLLTRLPEGASPCASS